MTFYLGGSNLTSQPYFGSGLISKIYKGSSLVWESDTYGVINSLDFQPNDYLTRTPTVVGNRKTWTFSTWVKRTNLSFANGHIFESAASPQYTGGYFNVSNQIQFRAFSGGFIWSVVTNETVADTQWHHLVFTYDSTQATAADRVKVYLDGTATTYASATYPALNADSNINNTTAQFIGTQTGSSGSLQAYLADIHMVDGQALDATSFAESSAVYGYRPKQYSGSNGTNGFHLKFTNASDPGEDLSGSNDFTWNGAGSIEGFGPTTDQNFSDVELLLHMDGQNGSTTFTDSGPATNTITVNGNAAISTTQSKFGGASGDFSNGGYLYDTTGTYDLTGSSWTVEGWAYYTSGPGVHHIFGTLGTNTTGSTALFYSGGVLYWQRVGTGTNELTYTWSPSLNQWYHLAVSWDGTTLRMFIDGTVVASNTVQPAHGSLGLNVGGRSDGFSLPGYLDDVRITSNVARYTSNFTPPIAAFPNS